MDISSYLGLCTSLARNYKRQYLMTDWVRIKK